jgi:hypothetical protein
VTPKRSKRIKDSRNATGSQTPAGLSAPLENQELRNSPAHLATMAAPGCVRVTKRSKRIDMTVQASRSASAKRQAVTLP